MSVLYLFFILSTFCFLSRICVSNFACGSSHLFFSFFLFYVNPACLPDCQKKLFQVQHAVAVIYILFCFKKKKKETSTTQYIDKVIIIIIMIVFNIQLSPYISFMFHFCVAFCNVRTFLIFIKFSNFFFLSQNSQYFINIFAVCLRHKSSDVFLFPFNWFVYMRCQCMHILYTYFWFWMIIK